MAVAELVLVDTCGWLTNRGDGHSRIVKRLRFLTIPVISHLTRLPAATESFNGKPKASAWRSSAAQLAHGRRRLRLAVKRRCAHGARTLQPKTLILLRLERSGTEGTKGNRRGYLRDDWVGCPFLGRWGARSVDSSPSCSAVRRTHGSPPQDRPRATQRPVAANSASVRGWPASLHQPFRSNSCGTRHPKW
jgi:hypothetical protein